MSKKKKSILAIFITLAVIAALVGMSYLFRFQSYKNAVANITYSGVEISTIPDGVYIGECDVDFIRAKVEVYVTEGRIEEIKLLEHDNDRGESATGIEQTIVAQQKVDVDVVSGATNSSKVIKKAVDHALSNAQTAQ